MNRRSSLSNLAPLSLCRFDVLFCSCGWGGYPGLYRSVNPSSLSSGEIPGRCVSDYPYGPGHGDRSLPLTSEIGLAFIERLNGSVVRDLLLDDMRLELLLSFVVHEDVTGSRLREALPA